MLSIYRPPVDYRSPGAFSYSLRCCDRGRANAEERGWPLHEDQAGAARWLLVGTEEGWPDDSHAHCCHYCEEPVTIGTVRQLAGCRSVGWLR